MTNWDNDIDDVARAMTGGEPDPALKARVLARLDERRRTWWSPWVLSPIGAAAIVIGAVFVMRDPRTANLSTPAVVRTDVPLVSEAGGQVRLPPSRAERAPASLAEALGEGGKPDTTETSRAAPTEATRTATVVKSALPRAPKAPLRTPPIESVATVARSDDMESIAPVLLAIEPLGVEAMDEMESIRITRLEVAPLEQPAFGAEQ